MPSETKLGCDGGKRQVGPCQQLACLLHAKGARVLLGRDAFGRFEQSGQLACAHAGNSAQFVGRNSAVKVVRKMAARAVKRGTVHGAQRFVRGPCCFQAPIHNKRCCFGDLALVVRARNNGGWTSALDVVEGFRQTSHRFRAV